MFLLLAAVAMLALGLPLPLTDGDTAFYATIAKNMLATGDWLTLHHRLTPVVDKPPLTFWLTSMSFAAFGTAEWALRLWHVVCAVAIALATYALARVTLSHREALASAVILLTTMQFFYLSLVPEQHVPLALFLTLAVYWHIRWEREGRLSLAVLAWLSAALAVLSIGIAAAVMVALVIGAHLIVDRPRLPRHPFPAAAVGAVVFLLVAAPWFLVGAVRQGRPFIDTFFLGGTLGVGRFFHRVQASPTVVPWWAGFGAYALLLPLGFLPWSGWLWQAFQDGWAARRSAGSILWTCTVWTIVIVGFLSMSLGDKSSRYLLPVFPPVAVLAGQAVANARKTRQAAGVSLAIALPLLALVTAVALVKFPGDAARYAPLLWSFLPAFTAGLCAYAIAAFLSRPLTGVILLTLLTLISYGLTMASVGRVWDEVSPWRPVARIVNANNDPGARLLLLGSEEAFADYYIARPVTYVDAAGLAREWRRARVVAVIPESALETLPASPPALILGRAPTGLVVVTNRAGHSRVLTWSSAAPVSEPGPASPAARPAGAPGMP